MDLLSSLIKIQLLFVIRNMQMVCNMYKCYVGIDFTILQKQQLCLTIFFKKLCLALNLCPLEHKWAKCFNKMQVLLCKMVLGDQITLWKNSEKSLSMLRYNWCLMSGTICFVFLLVREFLDECIKCLKREVLLLYQDI